MPRILLLLPITAIFSQANVGTKIFGPASGHGICYELNFDQKTYRIGTAMLDINPQSGTFVVSGSKLTLKPADADPRAAASVCTLAKSKNPFLSSGLSCGKGQYAQDYVDFSTVVPENSPVSFKGEQVIYMGEQRATAKTALRVRSKPGTKGRIQMFRTFKEGFGSDICREGEYQETDAMRAGESFTVMARTEQKSKVGKAEDYWYYVTTFDGCGRAIEGWSFGEFIELGQKGSQKGCRFN